MKVVAVVQTRMGSSRFPGKVMQPILGLPMIERMMLRLSRCQKLNEIVIATTLSDQDQTIFDFAEQKGYLIFRGSEEDVLGRYYHAAWERKADAVVRLTSDCPLIDPEITDTVVARHLASCDNDLTSNVFTRTFPRGFDTEVLSFSCLKRIHEATRDPLYREHVTNYIHDFPERFRIENVNGEEDFSHLRLCVDTEADLKLINAVYEKLLPVNPNFGAKEIYTLFRAHPKLGDVNAHIQQTKIFRHKNRA